MFVENFCFVEVVDLFSFVVVVYLVGNWRIVWGVVCCFDFES